MKFKSLANQLPGTINCGLPYQPFTNNSILEKSKFKASADDSLNVNITRAPHAGIDAWLLTKCQRLQDNNNDAKAIAITWVFCEKK